MKIRLFFFIILLCSLVGIWESCNKATNSITPMAGTYPDSISAILVKNCARAGCHDAASYQNAGSLLLDSWTHLFQGGVSGAVAVAYSPLYSPLLYYACPDSSLGLRVNDPAHPNVLTAAQYERLANWITQGAPDFEGNIPFGSNPDTRQKIYLTQQPKSGVTSLICVIDGASKLVMRYIPVGNSVNTSLHDVTITGDGNFAYVSFYSGAWMQKLDVRTDTVVGYADLSSTALGGQGQWGILQLSPGDTTILVTGFSVNGNVVAVKTSDMTLQNALSLDLLHGGSNDLYFPHGITNNPTFDTFYVTLQYGNVVEKYTFNSPFGFWSKYVSLNGATPVPGKISSGGPDPHQIQMMPDNRRYAVSCQNSNEVRIMDAYADTVLAVIPVGAYPQEMDLYPAKNYLFVACLQDVTNRPSTSTVPANIGTVFVIDYNTYQVVSILNGDFNMPHDIAVDSMDGFLYVASENNYNGSGTPAHHVAPGGGNAGWYTVYNLNTLQPADKIRYEVEVFPYAISARF